MAATCCPVLGGMPRVRLLAAIALAVLLAACGGGKAPQPFDTDADHLSDVRDARAFPQNLSVFAAQIGEDRPLIGPASQAERNQRFDRLFFSPWESKRASIKASDAFAGMDQYSRLRVRSKNPKGYAENLRLWDSVRWDTLVTNTRRDRFPSRLDKGVTVRQVSVRELPTERPWYGHPFHPGQGFPFDTFQMSLLPPGMPVLITHTSRDGAWIYVETALFGGWLPVDSVALVDAQAMALYQTGSYAAILRDDVPLCDRTGTFLTMARVGTVLPIVGQSGSSLDVLVPARDPVTGRAVFSTARLASNVAARKPLPLTAGRLAAIGNQFMGQPYGWGGMFGNRDCSSMLRDLFVPFGIWLPRNSAAQSRSWQTVSLEGLSPAAKIDKILTQGKPFATLLWLPGHITLYVGQQRGEPAIFHSVWGLRTQGDGKVSGRFILGRTMITSTQPGQELNRIKDGSLLIDRMARMTILR